MTMDTNNTKQGAGRRLPTQKELDAARAEMERPIYIVEQEQRGYRCADCDHWFPMLTARPERTSSRWLPRMGCPKCGSKELVATTGVRCKKCGGYVAGGDGEEHAAVCDV